MLGSDKCYERKIKCRKGLGSNGEEERAIFRQDSPGRPLCKRDLWTESEWATWISRKKMHEAEGAASAVSIFTKIRKLLGRQHGQ